jgi:hypothetical protein
MISEISSQLIQYGVFECYVKVTEESREPYFKQFSIPEIDATETRLAEMLSETELEASNYWSELDGDII